MAPGQVNFSVLPNLYSIERYWAISFDEFDSVAIIQVGMVASKAGIFRDGFFWVLDGNNPGDSTHSVGLAFAFGGITNDKPVVGKW